MAEPSSSPKLVCCKCGVLMGIGTVTFAYLGHNFSAELPKCPQCGQVYLSEELVKGKVTQVEISLEDK